MFHTHYVKCHRNPNSLNTHLAARMCRRLECRISRCSEGECNVNRHFTVSVSLLNTQRPNSTLLYITALRTHGIPNTTELHGRLFNSNSIPFQTIRITFCYMTILENSLSNPFSQDSL